MNAEGFRYNIEGLAEELEVDIKDIARLYSNYFIEMNEEMLSLRDLLEGKDWYMIQRTVHNVKGVSANLAVEDVFREAAAFDVLLKEGKREDTAVRIEKIASLLKAAEIDILNFFKSKGLELERL